MSKRQKAEFAYRVFALQVQETIEFYLESSSSVRKVRFCDFQKRKQEKENACMRILQMSRGQKDEFAYEVFVLQDKKVYMESSFCLKVRFHDFKN